MGVGDEGWEKRREAMVEQLRAYKVRDKRILAAMGKVRRHVYVPEEQRRHADPYGDHPCPIGYGQTISQPFIVAHMTERLAIEEGDRILEAGTGSGYQAAVLAELGAEVYSLEVIPQLAEHAAAVLRAEGYSRVHVKQADGYAGWQEQAPFDAIVGTCAPEDVPQELVDELGEGGRMILPIGLGTQRLVLLRRTAAGVQREDGLMVRFVPMVHRPEDKRHAV